MFEMIWSCFKLASLVFFSPKSGQIFLFPPPLFFRFCGLPPALLLLSAPPVGASLQSLCSLKDVADHRRRGWATKLGCCFAESPFWYALNFPALAVAQPSQCGTGMKKENEKAGRLIQMQEREPSHGAFPFQSNRDFGKLVSSRS